jgi:hypothetical protein
LSDIISFDGEGGGVGTLLEVGAGGSELIESLHVQMRLWSRIVSHYAIANGDIRAIQMIMSKEEEEKSNRIDKAELLL